MKVYIVLNDLCCLTKKGMLFKDLWLTKGFWIIWHTKHHTKSPPFFYLVIWFKGYKCYIFMFRWPKSLVERMWRVSILSWKTYNNKYVTIATAIDIKVLHQWQEGRMFKITANLIKSCSGKEIKNICIQLKWQTKNQYSIFVMVQTLFTF